MRITTTGPLGTLEGPMFSRFDSYIANHGDVGEYAGEHPDLEDWHFVKLITRDGVRYCPLHSMGFEAI